VGLWAILPVFLGVSMIKTAISDKDRIKVLRVALRRKYGSRKYRITSSGYVHVYSQMPHIGVDGWWLMGDFETAEDWMGIGRIFN